MHLENGGYFVSSITQKRVILNCFVVVHIHYEVWMHWKHLASNKCANDSLEFHGRKKNRESYMHRWEHVSSSLDFCIWFFATEARLTVHSHRCCAYFCFELCILLVLLERSCFRFFLMAIVLFGSVWWSHCKRAYTPMIALMMMMMLSHALRGL